MDYFFFLSIISSLVITGEAIKCYECSYCTELKKSTNFVLRDCPPSPHGAACLIVSYVLSNYTSGIRGRGCSYKSYVSDVRVVQKSISDEKNNSSVYIQLLSMYYCDFDLCNRSNLLFPTLYATVSSLFIHIIYKMY